MDAFFAAIEERDKPRLKGKPIVVGADPKNGAGRGVVATANYKAREYGIHSAQPISQAWRRSEEAKARGLSEAVFIGGNHRHYSEASDEIMEYLRGTGDAFEQASIDEAYVEFKKDRGDAWKFVKDKAEEIKKHIKKHFKLTCSIGVSTNKLVSKIAAGMEKPDGLTVVRPEVVQEFLNPQSVRVLPGVGPKMEEMLHKLHIYTIQELTTLSEEELAERFGKWGASLYRKARGISESPVVEDYEAKSVGEQETFEKDSLDPTFLVEKLTALGREVASRLTREGFKGKTISLTVRFNDFETLSRARTLSKSTNDPRIIVGEVLSLFMPFLDRRENRYKKLIRLLGVRVEHLSTGQEK